MEAAGLRASPVRDSPFKGSAVRLPERRRRLRLRLPEAEPDEALPENIPLDIVY